MSKKALPNNLCASDAKSADCNNFVVCKEVLKNKCIVERRLNPYAKPNPTLHSRIALKSRSDNISAVLYSGRSS